MAYRWRYRECWNRAIDTCDHCEEMVTPGEWQSDGNLGVIMTKNRGGHGLYHSFIDRLPTEVQVKIGVESYNVCDLTALGQTCGELRKVAASAWAEKVNGFLKSHGSTDPQRTLKVFTKYNALISGPGLAAIMFKDINKCAVKNGWTTRLEIYIPIDKEGKEATIAELTQMGFSKDYQIDYHTDIKKWANECLFYPQFGATIRRINLLVRTRGDGEDGTCVLFETKFVRSAVASIAEQPTTLLMNYIDGSKIHILYPHLTLKQQGLINVSQWSTRLDKLTLTDQLRKAGMAIDWDLAAFEGFGRHRCSRTLTCPGRDRTDDDEAKMEISFRVGIVTQRQEQADWVRTRFRKVYASWRLKCSGSCFEGNAMETFANAVGRYTVGDLTFSKS